MFAGTVLTLSGVQVSSGFNFWQRKRERFWFQGEEKIINSCDHSPVPVSARPSGPTSDRARWEIIHSCRPSRERSFYLSASISQTAQLSKCTLCTCSAVLSARR